ncbi:GIY-YIG nuclease family protein [Falsihalocynthiibacter arcticus]|uniref:GIY-YIG domain-containing protein n=1 Tax=Falsihalocynthiibacter arcticus TaxID=1579316 RepID=A0A126UZI2_9RHOB|nr:GIY-YIG nuclease family protein [Falsihalocynthiibacter arcticus]AML51046.1 hypothetical protein RC74_06945 [Falsihalocynthiibacter arcticus]
MEIPLSQIWQPTDLKQYKVHFARWNGDNQPFRVLARSMTEWQDWQAWYPSKNDFNRPYIFALAQLPEAKDYWMFGGIWKVLGTKTNSNGCKYYDVALDEELQGFVGRLKLQREHKQRGTRLKLEGQYEHFIVSELLSAKYTGRAFPGYGSVNLSFQELESLIAHSRQDWATALGHVKGVYLITDINSQRRYVGSAYGELGVWARWSTYANLGHGGNAGMRKLLEDHDLDYCRRYFKFTLLEHLDARTDDSVVLNREGYWKQVLDTRHTETGLNLN